MVSLLEGLSSGVGLVLTVNVRSTVVGLFGSVEPSVAIPVGSAVGSEDASQNKFGTKNNKTNKNQLNFSLDS